MKDSYARALITLVTIGILLIFGAIIWGFSSVNQQLRYIQPSIDNVRFSIPDETRQFFEIRSNVGCQGPGWGNVDANMTDSKYRLKIDSINHLSQTGGKCIATFNREVKLLLQTNAAVVADGKKVTEVWTSDWKIIKGTLFEMTFPQSQNANLEYIATLP